MRTEQFMDRSMYLLYLWKFFSFFPPASLLKVYSEVNIRIKNLKLISAFHTIIKFGRDLRLTSPAVSPNLPSPIIISLSTTSMRLEGWLCHLSGQLVSKPHQFNASQQVCQHWQIWSHQLSHRLIVQERSAAQQHLHGSNCYILSLIWETV